MAILADAASLPVVHTNKVLDVADGERLNGCVDVSIFTQHARCASSHETAAKTYAVGQTAYLNPIRVMTASGHSAISEAATSVGMLHDCSLWRQSEDLLVAGT